MLALKFFPYVFRQASRRITRTALTVLGVATAMFLFCTIQALQDGMKDATEANASETTLIVYRENRFCPFTSKLPERYGSRIAAIKGVKSVIPMKIIVSNCRASLDVITFRGVPPEKFAELRTQFRLLSGSFEEWAQRSDAAFVRRNARTPARLEIAATALMRRRRRLHSRRHRRIRPGAGQKHGLRSSSIFYSARRSRSRLAPSLSS